MTSCGLFLYKVTRESLKEQIFDVSHHGLVKSKLKDLLSSEIVAVNEMQHDEPSSDKSVDEEGILQLFGGYRVWSHDFFPSPSTQIIVRCGVGDWVEVRCDYSRGHCSEGGTGVVVAMEEGV